MALAITSHPGDRCSRSQPYPEMLAHSQGAHDAVLVKPPAPVGPAVVRAIAPADLLPASLRAHAGGRVDGVGVGDRADHSRRVDRLAAVERDAELTLRPQRLPKHHV